MKYRTFPWKTTGVRHFSSGGISQGCMALGQDPQCLPSTSIFVQEKLGKKECQRLPGMGEGILSWEGIFMFYFYVRESHSGSGMGKESESAEASLRTAIFKAQGLQSQRSGFLLGADGQLPFNQYPLNVSLINVSQR